MSVPTSGPPFLVCDGPAVGDAEHEAGPLNGNRSSSCVLLCLAFEVNHFFSSYELPCLARHRVASSDIARVSNRPRAAKSQDDSFSRDTRVCHLAVAACVCRKGWSEGRGSPGLQRRRWVTRRSYRGHSVATLPWDASRSISHVAEMPQPPGDRQPCHERSRFKNGSFDAAQAPELRTGLHPLVLTRSVIVGLPLAAPRSGQAAVAGQSGPGRVGVGPRGHWQSESLALRQWPLAVTGIQVGHCQSDSSGLAARHRQVP